jgi:hypothetical protein
MKIYSTFLEHLKAYSKSRNGLLLPFISLLSGLIFFGITCPVLADPPSPKPLPSVQPAVSPSAVPGPPPLPASPPTEAQLVPPNPGDEDATQNVHTASPDTEQVPGPPPADEGILPGPPTAADPNALIPAAGGMPSDSAKLTAAQQKEATAKELVKYKAVKVQAEKNPAICRMYRRAQSAPTEEDYRAAMREYYRMLFKKIELLDPSLTEKARGMREAYLRKLAQTKIEPTIPLHPPPTPEPLTP